MNKQFTIKYFDPTFNYEREMVYPTLEEAQEAKGEFEEQGYEVEQIEVLFVNR